MIWKMTKAEKYVFLTACKSFGIPIHNKNSVYPHNVTRLFDMLAKQTSEPENIEFADKVARNAEICQQAEEMITVKCI
jgi:hypothetical protein